MFYPLIGVSICLDCMLHPERRLRERNAAIEARAVAAAFTRYKAAGGRRWTEEEFSARLAAAPAAQRRVGRPRRLPFSAVLWLLVNEVASVFERALTRTGRARDNELARLEKALGLPPAQKTLRGEFKEFSNSCGGRSADAIGAAADASARRILSLEYPTEASIQRRLRDAGGHPWRHRRMATELNA